MSTQNTAVENFLTAFYAGDADAARTTITEDFTFVGPFATVHGPDEFFKATEGLLKIVRGHRVMRHVIEGDNVTTLYDIVLAGPSGEGTVTTSGWFTVTGAKLSAARLIFDTAQFKAIVSPPPV